ncbi:AMP-binding protein [Nocardia alni]|uniref:AMP-binding protein n=1 Tax=Nocardia alni TaxID=2815723 RepID=UPI001C22A541|nr:AMP-binding protein [Nocardia alni]
MGIRDHLSRLLAEAPADAEAIEYEQLWWTWGDIRATARATLEALDSTGAAVGNRVGVVLENRPEHIAVVAALIASGRCVVALSPLQPAARLSADIARCELPAVVASPEILARTGVFDAVTAKGTALELTKDGSVQPTHPPARQAIVPAHKLSASTTDAMADSGTAVAPDTPTAPSITRHPDTTIDPVAAVGTNSVAADFGATADPDASPNPGPGATADTSIAVDSAADAGIAILSGLAGGSGSDSAVDPGGSTDSEATNRFGAVVDSGVGAEVDSGSAGAPGFAVDPGDDDIAVEMLTSGTTGPPKRVHLWARQLDQALLSGGQTVRRDRLLSTSASMVSAPLVHIGGLWRALACLTTGRRMILMARFDLEPWVSAVERHRLRTASLVPAALRAVLDAEVPAERLSSLRTVTSGTAPCPKELADSFFRTYGIPVLMTYGATEFAGAVAGWTLALHEQWWDRKAGSAGRAFGDVGLRVLGEDGVEAPAGTIGRLEVRTAQTAQGDRSWVRTSDLAHIDDDGFLWIDGRADDTIIRGGFKVRPRTVEAVLEKHAAVREAAVAGLPDTRLGHVPVAAVEPEPGHTPPERAELLALCRAHLLPYEVPLHIVVLDQLPRTPSSKVSRADLLDIVRDRLAGRTPA